MLEPSYISPLSVQDSTLWDGTVYIQGTPFPFDELSGNSLTDMHEDMPYQCTTHFLV